MWDVKPFWNYTSVDPKQFTVSKFRLKPVILISECFCSRCGHTNQHPPPTWRETKGDKTTSEPKKAATPTNTHPPHEGRQPETTGDKTTSEPKKPTTPTNTKAARSKVALRTPTVNCLGKKNNHWTHQGTAWRHIASFFKLLFSKSSRRPWIWSRCVVPNWVQKTKNRISTRWFNLTFVESPIWRSLWIWTGHLMILKRSPKIARHGWSDDVSFRGVGWSL